MAIKKAVASEVAAPAERASRLAALRHRKMALSAHAFVRANAKLFYDVVAERLPRALPVGPHVWISADCHGENIGAVADARGRAKLKMNDFDEAVVGEPVFDVLRLALSLAMAGRASGLGGLSIARLVEGLAHGYLAELEARHTGHVPRDVPPPRFRKLLKKASEQTRSTLLDHRVPRRADGSRAFAYSGRYWPLTVAERDALAGLIDTPEVRHLVTTLAGADPDLEVDTVDAAFRIAGTASLGAWRAGVLVHVGNGKKRRLADDALRLIDVKEAVPAFAPRAPDKPTPDDDASRIVAGAMVLSPSVGGRMVAATVLKRRVVVRELLPQDLKASLADLEPPETEAVGRHLGAVVGRAHARQLTPADARSWCSACSGRAGRAAWGGPPAWLWDALVELVGVHEPAYLRHCVSSPG